MPTSTLYVTIEETIATEIAQGEYRRGDQLPTETDMVEANLGQLAGSAASAQLVKDYGQMLVAEHQGLQPTV